MMLMAGRKRLKILHYLHGLPPVRNGGLVRYVLDLAQGEYESGNDVQLLVPGSFSAWPKGKTTIRSKIWKQLPCHYVMNPLLVTEGRRIKHVELLLENSNFEVFLAFLEKILPDIIHMHSFMGIEYSFLEAAKKLKIPVVFTTHDYYGLCPKVNLFRNGENCNQVDWCKCGSCMEDAVSEWKIVWQHSNLYRALKANKVFHWLEYSPKILPYKIYVKDMLKKNKSPTRSIQGRISEETTLFEYQLEAYRLLREYYLKMYKSITCFHFNSRQSRWVFESYLENVKGEVIPITNRGIKDNRKIYRYDGKLKIGYLGGGQQFKGYQYLKETLDEMYESGMTEFECHVYFNSQDLRCPYLHCHEPYRANEMEAVFENIDVLVVPSLCRETFGMVVLEALSYGVPVILSSYVGAKEMLEDLGKQSIFEPDVNMNNLRKELERIYNDRCVLAQMNKKIYEWEFEWNFNEHVMKILNLYSKLTKAEKYIYEISERTVELQRNDRKFS